MGVDTRHHDILLLGLGGELMFVHHMGVAA
jgi:hypothetical protein